MGDVEKTQGETAPGPIREDSRSLLCRACCLEDKKDSRGQG